jgi:hypothetical protein
MSRSGSGGPEGRPAPAGGLGSARRSGAALGLAAALTLAAVLPVWTVAHPPLQDYPYHLVRAQILAEWSNPRFDYPATFSRDLFPTPYILVDYLLAGLGGWLTVPVAGKVVLALYLALLPWSLLWLLCGIDRQRAPLALLGLPLAYNWHFHMGFLNYSLSLPLALLTLGWWWRQRGRWGGAALAGLAAGITIVYLLHLYTWGLLLLVLAVMALARPGRGRELVRLGLAALPGLALLLALLARAPGEREPHAWLLLYGNPLQRAELVLGSLISFSLRWEGLVLACGLLVAVPLLVAGWRRGVPAEIPWALAALALLFLLLPDHVGDVYYISNRVPFFAFLLAVPLLALPAGPHLRRLAVAALVTLALLQLGGMAWRYRQIDARLSAYAAVLAEIPATARAGFRAHRPSMREGRIAPAAIFGGHHYLRAPGHRLPDLEHFVGFLRPVAYRERRQETMSTAAVRSREELSSVLSRRHTAAPGGMLVVAGGTPAERREIREVAGESAWRLLAAAGPVAVYLKGRGATAAAVARRGPVPAPPDGEPTSDGHAAAEEHWYATGYLDQVEYLAVYSRPEVMPPPEAAALEEVARRGPARLFRQPARPRPAPPEGPTSHVQPAAVALGPETGGGDLPGADER